MKKRKSFYSSLLVFVLSLTMLTDLAPVMARAEEPEPNSEQTQEVLIEEAPTLEEEEAQGEDIKEDMEFEEVQEEPGFDVEEPAEEPIEAPQETTEEAPTLEEIPVEEELPVEEETPAPKAMLKNNAPLKAPSAGDYQLQDSDITTIKTYVKKTDSSGDTWQETNTVGDGDSIKIDVNYHVNAGSVTNGKMYYELPAGIANLDTSSTFNIVNGSNPSETLGTYKFTYDETTKRYTIEMELDPNFNYQQAFDGTISVEGEAKNNKDSGNDVIDFGGSHTITVAQDRTVADFSLRKQGGSRTPDGEGGGTVFFEYFIGSYNGTNVIHITDTATAQNVDIDITKDVTITYAKGTYKGGTVYPENFTGWGSAKTMTVSGANFKDGITYDLPALDSMEGYWVRYNVPYKADPNDNGEEKKLNNTVKASTTNAPDDQSTAGTTWDKPTIKKTSTKPSNNQAVWTITIGESGQDLSGFKLKDVLTTEPAGALEELGISQPKTITITSINGNAANKKITLTNGEYTFPEGTTGYLVLKYTTTLPIIPSSTVKLVNTATLTTDEGEETAVGEEEFVGIPGEYGLTKLGPDELDGGDTTNTAVKDGNDITMSWKSTILYGPNVTLENIYYYDYTEINGSSSSAPTNNWVTKNTLKNDLVIKNSDGETLQRGVDYVVLVNYQKNDPTYSETKGYYEDSGYNRMFNIDQNGYSGDTYAQTLPDAKQGRFQVLFLTLDKISGKKYLTVEYKTYGTLPAEGSTNTYTNNAKITATDERSAEHIETTERSSFTIEKKVQEEPGSDKYVDNPVWWYSKKADNNKVGYRVRVEYNPDAPKQTPIIITDVLPEGMEYVDGSGEVGQWQYTKAATTFVEKNVPLDPSKYSVSYNASTRTITVTITDYETSTGIITAFGRDWGPYPINSVDFYYDAKLTDDVWNNKDTVQKRYANTASLDGQDDEATAMTTFLRPKDNNTKGSVRITDYDSNNQPVTDSVHEKYYLIINPQEKDLDPDKDTLVVDDTITVPDSVSAEFLYDEFKVYEFDDQIPKHPSADDLTGTELPSLQYSYTYDEHTHNLKVTVPDEKGIVIVYGYRYAKNTDSNPTVTNTANIVGVADSSSGDSTLIDANNSSATITQRNFHVRKHEEGNTGKLLQGSQFELVRYEANRDSTGKLDPSSTLGKKVVIGTKDNSSGSMNLVLQNEIGSTGTSSSDDVAPYTLFSLRETTVPDGYTADTTKLYFFAWKDIRDTDDEAYTKLQTAYNKVKQADWPDFPSVDDITFAANTGTLNVGNEPDEPIDPTDETVNLTIGKTTTTTSTEEFEFIVKVWKDETMDLSRYGTDNGDGTYTIKVRAGNTVKIEGIPKGYQYKVTEKDKDGWKQVSVEGDTTKELNEDATVTFKNEEGLFGDLKIEKEITGAGGVQSDTFNFKVTLKDENNAPIANTTFGDYTTNASGEITFTLSGGQSVTIPNLEDKTKYEIVETDAGTNGYEKVFWDKTPRGTITGKKPKETVSFKATNEKLVTEVSGTKTWVDEGLTHDNESEVHLVLKRKVEGGSEETVTDATLEWSGNTYTFKNLPKRDSAGNEYTYSVSESPVPTNYMYSHTGNNMTNTKYSGGIRIEKKAEGNAIDSNDSFEFAITLKKSDGTPLSGTFEASLIRGSATTSVSLTFDANGQATYSLKADEALLIRNLYYGVSYTVKETDKKGYTNTQDEKTGTISKLAYEVFEFTNTKNTYGDLSVKKVLDGNDTDANKDFAFTVILKDKDDQPLANTTIGSDTTDAEGKITFNLKGNGEKIITDIPNGTKYEVSEANYATDGYEAVAWSGNTSGTIINSSATENTKINLIATNTRNTYGDVIIKKTETGNDTGKVTDFEFTVTAEDKDGNKLSGTYGAATFSNGTATVKVKAGEQVKLENLPNGTKYSIVEKDYTTSDNYDAVSWDTTPTNKTIVGGQGTNTEVSFTATNNRDTYGDLAVKKILDGNDQDPNKEFEFTVTLKDTNNQPIANTTFGDYTTNASGEVTLKVSGGNTKTITGLPNGTKYEVKEKDYTSEGYEAVQLSTNATGTIAGAKPTNSLVTVTATNTKNTYGDIKIKKVETGNDQGEVTDFEFTVTFTDAQGTAIAGLEVGSYTTNAQGQITFTVKAGQEETLTSIPNGTKYTIVEKDYTSNGYDRVAWSAQPNGTIVGAVGNNSLVEFTATNNRDTFGDIEIAKVETGNDTGEVTDFEFIVVAEDADGEPLNGTFGDYTFTDGETTVTVKAGETKTIKDLPNGTVYSIEETDYADKGYDAVEWDEEPTDKTIVGAQDENSKVSFTATNNRDTYGDIEITKVETGNDPGEVTDFEFTVTAEDKDGNPIDGTYGEATFAQGTAVITVQAGQTKTITDLPNGTVYSIVETDYTDQDYDAVEWTEEEPTDQTIVGAQDENSKVTFTATNNRDTVGDLIVKKTLEGNGTDSEKEFTFIVTLDDETMNSTYGEMEFENGVATFTLKGGESCRAVDLPNGITYTVKEEDYSSEGYATTYDENQNGTIVGNDEITTTVTNARYVGALTVVKQLEGSDTNDNDEFAFEIVLDDTTVNGTYGDVTFTDGKAEFVLKGNEQVIIESLLQGIQYTVTETDDKGYTATHSGNTGSISSEAAAVVTYVNKRDTGETTYSVEKVWDDRSDKDRIRPESIQVQLYANGEAYGDPVTLTNDALTYTWDVLPLNKDGVEIVYSAEEVAVPEGYTATKETEDKKTTITNKHVPEEREKKDIKISKIDFEGFDVYAAELEVVEEDETFVDAWTTDGTPHELSLEVGTIYIFRETTPPFGYAVVSEFTFQVQADGTVKLLDVETNGDVEVNGDTLLVMDRRDLKDTAPVAIDKVDEAGKALSGATLRILDSNNNVMKEWTSDGSMETIFLQPGLYTLKEISAPKGYDAISDIAFEVLDNQGNVKLVDTGKNTVKASGNEITVTDKKTPEPYNPPTPGRSVTPPTPTKGVPTPYTNDDTDLVAYLGFLIVALGAITWSLKGLRTTR